MRKNYGKLNVKNLDSQVYKMWLSRNEEPKFCEPVGWSWMHETDTEQFVKRDLIIHILQKTQLTENEEAVVIAYVLEGATFREIAKDLNRTNGRIQQILNKALRKLRHRQQFVTGINPYEIDDRVMPWFWWKFENAKTNKKKTLETH